MSMPIVQESNAKYASVHKRKYHAYLALCHYIRSPADLTMPIVYFFLRLDLFVEDRCVNAICADNANSAVSVEVL